tara:strand:- start:781 stop:1236 length:456 start_codon:yes stop_codon:yes gene_type:complete
MLKKIKQLTAILCCVFMIITPTVGYSEGLVTELKPGDEVPFKGILLSNETAAKLFADIKYSKKECDARLEKELEFSKIKFESLLKTSDLKLEVETNRLNGMLSVRDDRIKFLEDNYRPPAWYESGEFWFAFGVVAGIGITTAAGYAIGQAK